MVVGLLAVGGALLATGVIGGDDGSAALTGSDADDKLTGTEGDDVLDGRAGEDVVEGQAGNDEITGGDDADFLYGGDGDDRFLASEDDAVDVHDCGSGTDFVAEPDTRDELLPSCEEAAWTARPPGEPYENTIAVQPKLQRRTAEFAASCPGGCAGVVELRTPHDRKLLGKGRFEIAADRHGRIRAPLNARGEELLGRGGYFRIVLRVANVNSGFTTFLAQ